MKHENLSDFLLWIFAFLFLIGGAALTSETAPGGLFIIFGGTLMLPSFSSWSENVFKVKIPLWVRVGAFAIFLLVGAWFSGEKMRSDLELPRSTQMGMYR